MEDAGEKITPPKPDAERFYSNVGVLLARGYAVGSREVNELAIANGLNSSSALGRLNSKRATEALAELGVAANTQSQKGRKYLVDSNGATRPEEINKTRQLIDRHFKEAAKK